MQVRGKFDLPEMGWNYVKGRLLLAVKKPTLFAAAYGLTCHIFVVIDGGAPVTLRLTCQDAPVKSGLTCQGGSPVTAHLSRCPQWAQNDFISQMMAYL